MVKWVSKKPSLEGRDESILRVVGEISGWYRVWPNRYLESLFGDEGCTDGGTTEQFTGMKNGKLMNHEKLTYVFQ